MDVTLAGIAADSSLVQPSNALSPNDSNDDDIKPSNDDFDDNNNNNNNNGKL